MTKEKYRAWAARAGTVLFYTALLAEIVIVILDKSAYLFPYESQVFRLTFLLFLGSLFLDCIGRGFSKGEVVAFTALSAFGIVLWRVSGRDEAVRAFIFVLAAARQIGRSGSTEAGEQKILTFWCAATGLGMAVLAFLSFFGILGTLTVSKETAEGGQILYCFGMGHPNACHCMAAMWLSMCLYCLREKLTVPLCAALFAANAGLFLLTHSRTAALAAGSLILLYAFFVAKNRIPEEKKAAAFDKFVPTASLVFLLGLLFCTAGAVWNPRWHPVLSKIDGLLTGRVSALWDTTFHEGTLSTWHLFGSRENETFFDLGMIRIVYWYGTVFAVLFFAAAALVILDMKRKDRRAALILVFVLLIYTIFEAHLVSVYIGRCFCLVFFASYAAEQGRKREEAI